MDLVRILNEAIDRLPKGDHSPGLVAIMRHISIAIRHFERRGERDSDSYTDAIYRTNQAYEGSLKEAYRVLASKDPSGITPNDIEKYLEEKNIVRPRVLTQLSRYRQDYRNPSTHDYKLDFDEDEALLAIVSVSAFAKLLIDQISEQLAFRAAAAAPPVGDISGVDLSEKDSFISAMTTAALDYTKAAAFELTSSEFTGGLAGRLASLGADISLDTKLMFDDTEFVWDVFAKLEGNCLPVETRSFTDDVVDNSGYTILFAHGGLESSSLDSGLVVMRHNSESGYHLYRATSQNIHVFIISQLDIKDVRRACRMLDEAVVAKVK